MQGGHHYLRHSPRASFREDEADSDADGADETEDGEVGEEDELPGSGLHHVHADTERDDELVTGDSCNKHHISPGRKAPRNRNLWKAPQRQELYAAIRIKDTLRQNSSLCVRICW